MFDFFGFKKKPQKIKVLVVDDEPNIVQTLKDALK
jgi:response regulator RpfG family c-di-GMP phosphodiesterase